MGINQDASILKAGIIGTGEIARDHVNAISCASGITLVAAADLAAERLNRFCDLVRIPKRYNDAKALTADDGIDLVVVATPPSAHEEAVIAGLEAGKYVFCEKPLAHSLASAARICDAAARCPGRLVVGYQYRYDSARERLLWLCRNGWIGEIQCAAIESHGSIPEAHDSFTGWWGKWNVAGGGVLITKLIHDLDMLLLVMGRPISVTAKMDTRFAEIESEDYVEATVRFSHGKTATCIASVNSGYVGGGFSVKGKDGVVGLPWSLSLNEPSRLAGALYELNRVFTDMRTSPASISSARLLLPTTWLRTTGPTNHTRLYTEIIRCIRNDMAPPISATEALASLELCMAIYESAIIGKTVNLPLSSENVVYSGISKEMYVNRKCGHNKQGIISKEYLSLLPGTARTTNGKVGVAKDLVRKALNFCGIRPALVKALLRRPAPVHGGPPVRRLPWPRRRNFNYRERRAVLRVMNREIRRGGAVAYGGAETRAYCDTFADYLGGGFAHAVNSGTNAIYAALRALELEPGSEVIVPPITDPGGMMPVPLTMCIPVPADSCPGSILTSAEQIRAAMSERTSAILVAHMGGYPTDMDPILELAAEREIPVVEDCAQAHGAIYKGRMVGTLGTISAFSTMFGKHHSTGGQGGVVFTRDPLLLAKVRRVADRGKRLDIPGNNRNVVAALNFNQDEISMAIGRVQLDKLTGSIHLRRAFVSRVADGLKTTKGVSVIGDPPGCVSSFWYLMMRVDQTVLRCDSQEFACALVQEGIEGAGVRHSVYPTDQSWYRNAAVFGKSRLPWSINQIRPRVFELPNAHQANRTTVYVDVHESLRMLHADQLVRAVKKIARYYTRTGLTLCEQASGGRLSG